MVLALLLFQVVDKRAFPDVLVAPFPPVAVDVKVMPALKYRLRRVAPPIENQRRNRDGSLSWKISGRWYRFKCPDENGRMGEITPGRDGSAVFSYTVMAEPMRDGSDWRTNPEHKAALKKMHDPEGWYQDPKNYIGCDYDPGIMFAESPLTLTQIQNGVKRKLGWGAAVRTWWPRDILARVPVDAESRPSAMEGTDHQFLRFYHDGAPTDIGDYEFLSALPDRSLLLYKWNLVGLWGLAGFKWWVRMPEGWKPILANRRGDVLARHVVWSKIPGDDDTDELVWEMGILSGGKLYPLQFTRPANTRKLLWLPDEKDRFDEGRRYRFNAFWDGDERYYELTPRG